MIVNPTGRCSPATFSSLRFGGTRPADLCDATTSVGRALCALCYEPRHLGGEKGWSKEASREGQRARGRPFCRTAREASIRTSITDFRNSELRSAVIDGCEGDARRAGLERRAVENRAEPRSPRPWAMPHVVNNGFCEENTTTLLRATSTAYRTCGLDGMSHLH